MRSTHTPSFLSACLACSPGWLVHWGEKMANTSADVLTDSFKDILAYNNGTGSVNFYMAHGGTNFAWTAGLKEQNCRQTFCAAVLLGLMVIMPSASLP